jgi:hypothetical protein
MPGRQSKRRGGERPAPARGPGCRAAAIALRARAVELPHAVGGLAGDALRALQLCRPLADHESMHPMATTGSRNDDPRKLRDMLGRAEGLASEHALHSVMVGVAGQEGDLLVPELLDFFESQLRMDDSIFRMTRERAVLLLADVDAARAREIIERLVTSFLERFTPASDPEIHVGYFEVTPDTRQLTVKQVLPALFLPAH